MKLDRKKPYGVITGHAWARYEQDGILFDTQGVSENQEEEPKEIEVIFSKEKKDFALDNARDFLTNILADGPLARSVVFKECSANNQDWEKVKTAFADMGGEATQRKNVLYWKLKTT